MLKISCIESPGRAVTLRLEGRVIGPWVGELQKACEDQLKQSCGLTLNLADVEFVDRSGLELFTLLKTRRVLLTECTPFLRAQLRDDVQRPRSKVQR